VERVGNMNYPEQARRQGLAGALVLSVDVLKDGSVNQIRLLKSSGYDVLDEAAIRIVRLSAPFAPLPEEIRREYDVLTITRTWQFSSSGVLRGGWFWRDPSSHGIDPGLTPPPYQRLAALIE